MLSCFPVKVEAMSSSLPTETTIQKVKDLLEKYAEVVRVRTKQAKLTPKSKYSKPTAEKLGKGNILEIHKFRTSRLF